MVGRSKLKDGSCIDIEACIKLIKWQKTPKEGNHRPKNLLESHYFDNYRTNGRGSLRVTGKTRPQETRQEEETD